VICDLYHNFGFIPFLNYGWLGVDLFFVFQAFSSQKYYKPGTPPIISGTFIPSRIKDISLYYLCLILVIIIFPLLKNFPYDLTYYKENQAWFWFYLQNWMLIFKDWNDNAILLNHFWSLAVEEQFYIVWPLWFFIKNQSCSNNFYPAAVSNVSSVFYLGQ
jgi:peptidoglycan/LPS O-acetylase OafA/YrhL